MCEGEFKARNVERKKKGSSGSEKSTKSNGSPKLRGLIRENTKRKYNVCKLCCITE